MRWLCRLSRGALSVRLVSLLIGVIVGAFGTSLSAAPAERAPLVATQRPNIVIVLVDDVGYGDFSCHGNPVIRTPHVDGFYRQSVRFTDFHVSPPVLRRAAR